VHGSDGALALGVRTFFTINQGHAFGAPGRPAPAGFGRENARASRVARAGAGTEPAAERGAGTAPTPGPGGMPRPAGREPSGRGAAARSAGPHPRVASPRRNASRCAETARTGRAVLHTPSGQLPCERSQRPGGIAAHCPERPLQRQGHPKILSNRSAERIFGDPPLTLEPLPPLRARRQGPGQRPGPRSARRTSASEPGTYQEDRRGGVRP
jgi:hypothetical protein